MTKLEIPPVVMLELTRFVSLVPLCFMDFRVPLDSLATASDASTYGGGITVSTGLTEYGRAAACSEVRGDVLGVESHCQVLSIGLFDGIGALRVALDCLEVSSIGHISVETSRPRAVKSDTFKTVSMVKGGARLCKPWNDGRGCATKGCTSLHQCDVKLESGQPCLSRKHTRLEHE